VAIVTRRLLEYRCRKCGQLVGEVRVKSDSQKEFRVPRESYGDVGQEPGEIRIERRHGVPVTYSETDLYQVETLGAYWPVCGSCKVDFMLMFDRVVDDIAVASRATRPPLRIFLDPIR